MTALPVDAATRGTLPEFAVAGAHAFRHESIHRVDGDLHQAFVAERAPRERIEETQGEPGGDLPNLLLEYVGPNRHAHGDASRKLFVSRKQDAVLRAGPLDQRSIRTGFRIRRVVPHEPQPPGEASQHVVAEQFHRTTEYSSKTPSPRRSERSSASRIDSESEAAPSPPARVGAERPPRTRLPTKTFSSSTRPARRNDQITVPPPSTRRVRIPRPPSRSSRAPRSTSSFPHRRTSARANVRSEASDVTMSVGAWPSRTRACSGVRPSESRTIRSGLRSATSGLVVSFGSSLRTVPTPTRIASTRPRRRCTRCTSSSLLRRARWPSRKAIFPSRLIAALTITRGRTTGPKGGKHNKFADADGIFFYLGHLPPGGGTDEGPSRARGRHAVPRERGRGRGDSLRCRGYSEPSWP